MLENEELNITDFNFNQEKSIQYVYDDNNKPPVIEDENKDISLTKIVTESVSEASFDQIDSESMMNQDNSINNKYRVF